MGDDAGRGHKMSIWCCWSLEGGAGHMGLASCGVQRGRGDRLAHGRSEVPTRSFTCASPTLGLQQSHLEVMLKVKERPLEGSGGPCRCHHVVMGGSPVKPLQPNLRAHLSPDCSGLGPQSLGLAPVKGNCFLMPASNSQCCDNIHSSLNFSFDFSFSSSFF